MTTHASSFTPLDDEYPLGEPETLQYRRDGQILLRRVASSSSIDRYRPLIREVVHEKTRQNDSQGRIEDYSSLFIQVTNVWHLNEELRRFVFARRFARIAAELMGVEGEKRYPVVTYALNAGDATFHSGWTVHAAHPNRSATQREVITVIYYADGTRILEPDSEFRRVDMEVFHPGQNPGDVAASPLNPFLYRRP
jgi:hypothetical protein